MDTTTNLYKCERCGNTKTIKCFPAAERGAPTVCKKCRGRNRKLCVRCGKSKALTLFRESQTDTCIECVKKASGARYMHRYTDEKANEINERIWRSLDAERQRQVLLAREERRVARKSRAHRRPLPDSDWVEARERIQRQQDNKCAICGIEFSRFVRPHMDHCHQTNALRGVLCSKCNGAIGMLNDDPDLMQKAAAYVVHHRR